MSWLKYLLIDVCAGICIALLLRRFVCMLVYVKGRSMQDTLQSGEIVFAVRRRIHSEIRRFDVVLCRYPKRKELFIKRIVGLPGECISIEDDTLLINGEPVEENFPRRRSLCPMTERELEADEYFVLGDNRPASKDSRSVGPIPRDRIIAVVKCVVFRKIRRI